MLTILIGEGMIPIFCEMKCKENYNLLSLYYVICILISPDIHIKPAGNLTPVV